MVQAVILVKIPLKIIYRDYNKTKKTKNLIKIYGNFNFEFDGDYLKSSMFQTGGDFLTLGYNHSTNSFENSVDPLSEFFNDNAFEMIIL